MPYLVRLEYLTPEGWEVGHHGIALLDPGAYVERLRKRKKYGRAIELDDRLQPNGQVWEPDNLPDPSQLTKTERGSKIPALDTPCEWCETSHTGALDGSCLI